MGEGEWTIDCEGRFHELGDLVADSIDALRGNDNSPVDTDTLKDVSFILGDEMNAVDVFDPYFSSSLDILRENIEVDDSLALVPIVARRMPIDKVSIVDYIQSLKSDYEVENSLSQWVWGSNNLNKNFDLRLEDRSIGIKKETIGQGKKARIGLSDIRANMHGYGLRSSFGIGKGDNNSVVPDAPFSIDLIGRDGKLALKVGFWYKRDPTLEGNQNVMVVSQIQQPRGTLLPGHDLDSQMGIVGMEIAQIVARAMGFGTMETYSADKHPMFMQYPDRKKQFKGEFKGYYDSSAKALGFKGTRTTWYRKEL